jgi:hypothetical protein
MKYDSPQNLQDALGAGRSYPTCDSWYPSIGRGHYHKPKVFEECECWECQTIPRDKRQVMAAYDWEKGGLVKSFITIYNTVQYFNPKYYPKGSTPPPYIARVSFWGDDDFGMEKFFEYEEDARYFVCHLPSYISKEFLFDNGFLTI